MKTVSQLTSRNLANIILKYGNNDSSCDDIACELAFTFDELKIPCLRLHRNSIPTQSVLTITSNVVYGKKIGNTRRSSC
ncbi:hypothetical protein O9992_02690 [Vibrio lentus]|nr:hypothetical protein [Vibrio lentus]